ncbi:hypothetical protein VPH35_104721 [Triticum aestivum]
MLVLTIYHLLQVTIWASNDLHETFHLPVSPLALEEIRDIQLTLTKICPSTSNTNIWHYIWGTATFRPKDYYSYFFRDARTDPMFKHLWKSKCTMKLKVFGWLLFHDRLNTRNMLKRRHFNIGYDFDCLLCGLPIEETVDHMIFTCDFSRTCWTKLGIQWTPFGNRLTALKLNRDSWRDPFFMEIFLTARWSLWKEGTTNTSMELTLLLGPGFHASKMT